MKIVFVGCSLQLISELNLPSGDYFVSHSDMTDPDWIEIVSDVGSNDILVMRDDGGFKFPYCAGYSSGRGKIVIRVVGRDGYSASSTSRNEPLYTNVITCFSDEISGLLSDIRPIIDEDLESDPSDRFVLLRAVRTKYGPGSFMELHPS
jgi:hypothetical protein